MPKTKALSFSLSAFALSLASPALAVTADDLWAEWQAQSVAMNQTMAAESVVSGDGSLTLTGFTSTYSDGEVTTVARLDEIVLTENADGTVTIDVSDVYAITVTFVPDPGTPPMNLGFNIVAPDLIVTASGEVGARVYDYTASRITLEDGPISGGDGPPPTIDMTIGIEDFAATYEIDGTDPENFAYSSSSSFSGIAGVIDVLPPPDEVGRLKLAFSIGATTASGSGQLGNLAELAENPDTIPTGFDVTGDVTYASSSLDLTFEHPTDAFNLFVSNRGGSLGATVSETLIDYRITSSESSSHFASGDLPVPVEFSVGSAEIALSVPLAASPEEQPVAARLAYQDVIVSPQVWALADPQGAFPRDPITVIADLTGAVQVTTNLLGSDPSTMTAPPGELRNLTLNELRITAGGATLTGSGSAEFAPGPVPQPVGSVDLQLSGGNALLDTLQGAGIVPIEQLAMVRGMLGAFARPGATPDTLESTIEFTEGGGITANGVPLQ